MDPRIYLRKLLERLEPEVGRVSRFTDFEPEKVAAGLAHLADAVVTAREALQSGALEQIEEAAKDCQALERTGRDLQRAHEQETRSRAAGKASAAARKLKTETEAPFVKYDALFRQLAEGKDKAGKLKARRRVEWQMKKDGFVVPSPSTMRRRFPSS